MHVMIELEAGSDNVETAIYDVLDEVEAAVKAGRTDSGLIVDRGGTTVGTWEVDND